MFASNSGKVTIDPSNPHEIAVAGRRYVLEDGALLTVKNQDWVGEGTLLATEPAAKYRLVEVKEGQGPVRERLEYFFGQARRLGPSRRWSSDRRTADCGTHTASLGLETSLQLVPWNDIPSPGGGSGVVQAASAATAETFLSNDSHMLYCRKGALTWRTSLGESSRVVYPSMLIPLLGLAACGRVTPPAAEDASTVLPDGQREGTCSDLPLSCGPTGQSSCCDSKAVPGGTFFRGYDKSGTFYVDMSHSAQLSAFRLDTYEVTVGRFRQFVVAGYGTRAKPPAPGAGARRLSGVNNQGGWDPAWNTKLPADEPNLRNSLRCGGQYMTWTDLPGDNESLPIVCISWFEAMAFCIWDGGYLPTATESMYAMVGGSEQRAYPWSKPASSTAVSCATANYGGATWPATACNGPGATRVGATSPAGDGLYGQADLGGNAMEWVLDWAGEPSATCHDCAQLSPSSSGSRRLRGGSYQSADSYMRGASSFAGIPPQLRQSDVGVRCARP